MDSSVQVRRFLRLPSLVQKLVFPKAVISEFPERDLSTDSNAPDQAIAALCGIGCSTDPGSSRDGDAQAAHSTRYCLQDEQQLTGPAHVARSIDEFLGSACLR